MLILLLLLALARTPPASPSPPRPARSALDLRHHPAAPVTSHHQIESDRKPKAPFIPAQVYIPPHLLVLPARSSVHHSSVHTDVTHGHGNVPVVTHTVHHRASNITHPSKLGPALHYQPAVHDLSVIPLQHGARAHLAPRAAARSSFEQRVSYVPFPYFGGYGAGLRYGGHGAGHGYYVSGFR